MTTLVSLTLHRIGMPLVRPFVTAVRRAEAIEVVLVEALDSDGHRGWGEAPANWRVTGESPEGIRAVVSGPIAEAVLGCDVTDVDRWAPAIRTAVHGNPAARNAVECALQDLDAQVRGVPMRVALGAVSGGLGVVRTDMTLSAGSADDLVRAGVEHCAAGFRVLKVKVAVGTDTVAGLVELRAAVGNAISLRIDANQAWTPIEALRIVHACEDAGVGLEFVEQPVAARDIAGLAQVTHGVETPVLADESVWDRHDLAAVIELRAADLVNIKLAKSGGPSHAHRVAALAAEAGMGVLVGCMLESPVGVAAAASFAAAIGRTNEVHDLDAGLWLKGSPVRGGVQYVNDTVVLPDLPGLGIAGLSDRDRSAA